MLSKLFVESAASKVVDFILDEPKLDYSKKEIANKSNVSWRTVDKILPTLEELGLVQVSRKINNAQLYKINSESRVFRALKTLDFEISDISLAKKFGSDDQELTVKTTDKKAEIIAASAYLAICVYSNSCRFGFNRQCEMCVGLGMLSGPVASA